MKYRELEEFIQKRMRMSHVYQPVMLVTLLKIVGNMVGRVLRNHGVVTKEGNHYRLCIEHNLSRRQNTHLLELCQAKLDEYKTKRGELIWEHRKASAGYIPGTLKFEVLKAAQFHCELCGISADIRALEVDHIVPRNSGGTDDRSNLQVLCYSCNSMKRDRDATDFRKVRQSYEYLQMGCAFCHIAKSRVVHENELTFAVRDAFPVTMLHTLVIPKRHVSEVFDLSRPETNACSEILNRAKQEIEQTDRNVAGFNVGTNNGEAAGQTIHHCHIHLIPRRKGDVENPIGGVRNTIPGKGPY